MTAIKRPFNNTQGYYNNHIDTFDESATDSRNAFLTHKIGSYNYELISFSYPKGVIRLKHNALQATITHFIGPSFGYGVYDTGIEAHIYRVTGLRTIGAGVVEYDFEIDGLKEFFQHVAIDTNTKNLIRVLATTDKTKWNRKLLRGDEPITGGYEYKGQIIDYINTDSYRWLVVGTISGHALAGYLINDNQLIDLYNYFLTSEDSEKDASLIQRIELVIYSGTYEQDIEFEAMTLNGHTVLSEAARILPYNQSNLPYVVRYSITPNANPPSIYHNGGEYEAASKLYIQGFGTIDFDKMLKERFQKAYEEGKSLDFKLVENLLTGETSVEVDGVTILDKGYNTTMPIITNAAPLAIRQYIDAQKFGGYRAAAQGFAGAAGATGGNAAAAVAGSVVGMGLNFAQGLAGLRNLNSAVGPTVTDGANGYLHSGIFFIQYNPKYVDLEGYYDKVGYPCDILDTLNLFQDSKRYTCEVIGAIDGTKSWRDIIISEFQSDYWVYNYNRGYGV